MWKGTRYMQACLCWHIFFFTGHEFLKFFIFPLAWNVYVAFFYCEIDGSSLCLQCDMIVHVGGKRTHGRYLLLRQRVEVCLSGLKCFEFCIKYVTSEAFWINMLCLIVLFSFQGINLAVQRNKDSNRLMIMKQEGTKISRLSSQLEKINRTTGPLQFQW